jgi:hypothetical protein
MDNYILISLLPVFLKVLEKAMYCRLNHHLQANNILAIEQYGFRKSLSTEHATFSLTDSTLTAWNKKIHIGEILCDLTKAFDCVNHDILIKKLQYYGIQELTLNCFNAMNSVHFCLIKNKSNQMHYFYYLKLKKLFTIYRFDTLQIIFSFLKFTRHASAPALCHLQENL